MKKKDIKKILSLIIILLIGAYYFYTEEVKPNESVKYKESETKETTAITNNSNLNIYFIDVGQADSILITNNNEYMLIDAGNNEDGPLLVNYFKELGINEFKYVVGTHAHEDHIGGMDDIINNFKIDTFYMPDAITTTRTFEDVLDALENKSVAFETPNIDDSFTLSDVIFKVLYLGTDVRDLNDTSIVLKATYGSNSILLTGDATSKVEKQIINKNIQSDVLKVGHHGSNYSSTKEFLEKVNPKYAIISVGKNNTYKHPTDTTLEKLNIINAKIYRTDESGTIIMTSDGKNISFKEEKTNTNG